MVKKSPLELRNGIVKASFDRKKIDLRPGSFSRKWILADQSFQTHRVVLQPWEDMGNPPIRSPSPPFLTARSKLHQLSTNYKLRKESFVN